MVKLQVIIGSTRPHRVGADVAAWVYEQAQGRDDLEIELVDIADYNLPLLDEPQLPAAGNYVHEHTKRWSAKVAEADGYIFVTPEYNHGPSAALKNALDFVYSEWNNKAAAFVSYGAALGARAVEQLRTVMAQLQIADVRAQVMLSLASDFADGEFAPATRHEDEAQAMLDQLVAWAEAMKSVRKTAVAA